MSVVEMGLELPEATMSLELKKIEARKSGENGQGEYKMLYFNQCVKFDPVNPRNSRYLDIPYYINNELFVRVFKGLRPSQLIGKMFDIVVQFTPSLRTAGSGLKYAEHKASIIDISCEEDLPHPTMVTDDRAF